MKTLFLPLSLLIVLAVSLTSCVPLDDPAFLGNTGGGFNSGGGYSRRVYTDYGSTTHHYDNDDYGYRAPGYGSNFGPGGYFGGTGGYIAPGYACGANRLCNVCRRNPCCCRSASYYRRDDDDCRDNRSSSSRRSSSSSSRSRSDDDEKKYRYSGSVRRGDTKPEGNHSREWFKERGYSLKNLKPVN